MKKLGFKKRKGKLHPHNECYICSNLEDEETINSSTRRAREKTKVEKEIKEYEIQK